MKAGLSYEVAFQALFFLFSPGTPWRIGPDGFFFLFFSFLFSFVSPKK